MRPVLLHYHILKNGGSTIEEILRRSLPAGFLSFDRPDRDAEIKPAELIELLQENPNVTAFSSHQIFYPVPQAAGFLFFDICFLRDPLDRFRSVYDYFRAKPAGGDPVRRLAQQNSLPDFLRRLIDEMPWTVNNVQVNMLAHGVVNDPPRGPQDLDVATARMLETSFLGVVFRFEESLVAGEYAMRTLFPALDCAQDSVNHSVPAGSSLEQRMEQFRRDCGGDLFSELQRLNQMDLELLRRARMEVRRRFEKTPRAEQRLREIQGGAPPKPAIAVRHAPPSAAADPGAGTRLQRGLRFLLHPRTARHVRRLFDPEFYGGRLWHFITRGAFEGRNPHPLFDTRFYLSQCEPPPGENALSHYLEHGGRPHPLFDAGYYTRRYPDVAGARLNPLLHYVLHGAAEGRRPNAWFSPEFYRAGCPEAPTAKSLAHFAATAAANPHPLFDCESYAAAHPEITGNPLAHFLMQPAKPAAGVRFGLDEVEIAIVLAGDRQQEIFDRTGAAVVWRDLCGQKQFLCAPHLRRFFDCVRYDQLAAQL